MEFINGCIYFPCFSCNKPVDITDIYLRQMEMRSGWRKHWDNYTYLQDMVKEHPVTGAHCEQCCPDKKLPYTQVDFNRCNVKGCCQPPDKEMINKWISQLQSCMLGQAGDTNK